MNARDLILSSLIEPRKAARVLIYARFPMDFAWSLFGLGIVLSALLGHLATGLIHPEGSARSVGLSPFALTGLQALSQILVVLSAYLLGRFWGGQGRFGDVLILVSWVEILLVAVQAIDLAFLLVLPPLAGILPLVGVVITFWMMANFLAEVHGFASPWPVLMVIIGVSMLFGAAILTVLAQFGFTIGVPNV